MISQILKTLSDTEIIAIAQSLSNVEADEQLIYQSLISKGNDDENIQEMYSEMNSDKFRGTLPRLVALEISERYKEHLMSV